MFLLISLNFSSGGSGDEPVEKTQRRFSFRSSFTVEKRTTMKIPNATAFRHLRLCL